MMSIRICLLQGGKLYVVRKDLSFIRIYVIFGSIKTCLLEEYTLLGVNWDLSVTRMQVLSVQ
jgi:hypothetical protein